MIEIKEKLIISKCSSSNPYNREVFQKYKQYFSNISEMIYYYQNPTRTEKEQYCRTCGKKTKFINSTLGYQKHCNLKCANNDPQVKEKIHNSNMRIGKDGLTSYERGFAKKKKVLLEKYGVDNIFKDAQRMKKAYIEKLGVDNPFKKQDIKNKYKETCKNKYGVEWFAQTDNYKEKVILTKRKNNSFNKSEEEDLAYHKLLKKFKDNDVIRQYRSKYYPYNCDFYIPSQNLYIECNFSWVHGKDGENILGFFDKNNIKHQNVLNKWKQKNTKFYDNAIHIWTITDMKKLNTFKNNNLNYKIFNDMKEFDQWYKTI